MRRYALVALGTLLVSSLAAGWQQQSAPAGRTLKMKMNYTGAGTVDDTHKIYLFVFDTPDFMSGTVMPVAFANTPSKNGVVEVSELNSSPVYIVAAYDSTGGYDGVSGPPPSGSSITFYSKSPGAPEPVKIEPGQTTEVEVAFDDSMKMP